MKLAITIATLALAITSQGSLAATYPYSVPTTTKPAAKSSTSTTTTSKTATKPAPKPVTPPPPQEEPFFSNWGLGLILLSQSVDVTNKTGTTTTTGSESGSGLGIYAEKYFRGVYRLVGTVSYVGYDSFAISSATVAADYLMPMTPSLALFGGAAVGGAGQKYDDASFSDMALALVYGVQLGGIYYASDNFMLELGYRLRITDLETDITTTPVSTDSIDEFNETYLSLIVAF